MKKIVIFSLLIFNYPFTAFADTSTNVSDAVTTPSQTQVGESATIPDESITENQESTMESSFNSEETTEESQIPIAEDVETTDEPEYLEKEVEDTSEKKEIKLKAAVQKQKTTETTNQSLEILEKKEISEWTAEDIRFGLLNTEDQNINISKTELDRYTDQELMNALKLFERTTFDGPEMHLLTYLLTLESIYKDNVYSWADVEKALSFNMIDYPTTLDLARNIDQLQCYLRILQPVIPTYTNEELLFILNRLSGSEERLDLPINLFYSVLVNPENFPELSSLFDLPINHTTASANQNLYLATMSRPLIQDAAPISNTISTAKPDAQKEYPKTGERRTASLTIMGIIVFFLTGLVLLKRRAQLK